MRRTAFALALLLLALTSAAPGADGREGKALYAVDVSHLDRADVAALERSAAIDWWIEIGDVVVVAGRPNRIDAIRRRDIRRLGPLLPDEQLFVGHHVHPTEVAISRPAGCGGRVLVASGVWSVIAGTQAMAAALSEREPGSVSRLVPGTVYARVDDRSQRSTSKSHDSSIAAEAVDAERWHATVQDLANFGTRYTGTRGADAARDYLAAQFSALGLAVTEPRFDGGSGIGYDVVAEQPGSSRPDDIYIVCAHYDSISEVPTSLAPGAEDNGSGAAGVVELARVFAEHRPAATMRFITFSGEEEGLYGSKFYVDRLTTAGESSRVKGVINMDMIAFSHDDDLDVLLETSTIGVDLQHALAASARAYTSLRVVTSLHPFGSDHVPFLRAGIPCVLTIENDWDEYPSYHTSRDTIENVRLDMGGQILRMNAATLASLAGSASEVIPPSIALTAPASGHSVYAGFPDSASWTASGDITSIDVDASFDDGASYLSIGSEMDATARTIRWLAPATFASRTGRLRVIAHGPAGDAQSEVTIRLRSSAGPHLVTAHFQDANGGALILKGSLPDDPVVTIGDRELAGGFARARSVEGNTILRYAATDPSIDSIVPVGRQVRIRVVDRSRLGAAAEITFTR